MDKPTLHWTKPPSPTSPGMAPTPAPTGRLLARVVRAACAAALVVGVGGGVSGCGHDAEPMESPDTGSAASVPSGEDGGKGAREGAHGAAGPGQAAPAAPSRAKLAAALTSFVERWAAREASFVDEYRKGFQRLLKTPRWFKRLTSQAYEARDYALLFSDGVALNDAGQAMLQAVRGVADHGLDPKAYGLDELEGLVAAVERDRAAYDAVLGGASDPQEKALWTVLDKVRRTGTVGAGQLDELLAQAKLDDTAIPAIAGLRTRMEAMFAAKDQLNRSFMALDLALLGDFFRYAFDMRYARIAHPFQADASYGKGVERAAEALYARYQRTDFDRFDEALADLVPKIPDYAQLQDGLRRYRKLAAEVEQVKLPKAARRLKRGSRGKLVDALRRRLRQEGYFDGPERGPYDDALAEAVRSYQDTHQLKQTGEMSRSTVRSLNRTFAARADQIALGLMRFRESDLHQDPEFRFGTAPVTVRVNIPAFEAVFYRDGKIARRQRIVVGSNAVSVNERTGKKGYFNRTRLFSQVMKTVVLNPTWRVPARIKATELDREVMDEPDYYAQHNYEVRMLDDGTEEVVQLPGPKNALGLVKFLFPNQFSIYMHDTPKKRLFGRPLRAFSHGCMRVNGALDLAKWVLTEVEQMTPAKFKRILDSRETYGVAIKTRIALTIDYCTVGIHPSGRVAFYADIYRFDRDFRAGKTPYPALRGRGLEQAVLVP